MTDPKRPAAPSPDLADRTDADLGDAVEQAQPLGGEPLTESVAREQGVEDEVAERQVQDAAEADPSV